MSDSAVGTAPPSRVQDLVDSDGFASAVGVLVMANALLVGIETVDAVAADWSGALFAFFWISQALFVAEIGLRVAAEGPVLSPATWAAFLRDGWNRFDLAIVALTLVPMVGSFAPIARVFRMLRLLRVFSAFEPMRDSLEADRGVGVGVAPVVLLTGVAWYGFAVAGHLLFEDTDPARWGSLFHAFRSVFFLGVLSDVAAIVTPATDASPPSLGYFLAFYAAAAGIAIRTAAAVVRHAAGGRT